MYLFRIDGFRSNPNEFSVCLLPGLPLPSSIHLLPVEAYFICKLF
jgi:hypothetical protein